MTALDQMNFLNPLREIESTRSTRQLSFFTSLVAVKRTNGPINQTERGPRLRAMVAVNGKEK